MGPFFISKNFHDTYLVMSNFMDVKFYRDNIPALLTQEEVDNLEDGTKIIIIWSGGNGPHEWIYNKKWKSACPIDDPESVYGCHYLDFIGNQSFHTWVWLPN